MSNIISEISGDTTSIQTGFGTALHTLIHDRLVTNGLTDTPENSNQLTSTTASIVDAIKKQENILINKVINKIYNRIESKLLSNFKIESLNVVTDVSQDIFTKVITVTKNNIIANKSFI